MTIEYDGVWASRIGLDPLEKRRNCCPCRKWNEYYGGLEPVAQSWRRDSIVTTGWTSEEGLRRCFGRQENLLPIDQSRYGVRRASYLNEYGSVLALGKTTRV